MSDIETKQFTNVSVQILQRECDSLSVKVNSLEKELQKLVGERERNDNNAALFNIEHMQLTKEHKDIEELSDSLNKELNSWEASIRQPLQHYKDMKQGINSYASVCSTIQHLLYQIDLASAELKKSTATYQEEINSLNDIHDDRIRQASLEKKSAIASLQTQLKLIETRKKTKESQLHQKSEENRELTKICEDLIQQGE